MGSIHRDMLAEGQMHRLPECIGDLVGFVE